MLSFLLLVSNYGFAFNAVFCCDELIAISNLKQLSDDCHTIKKVSISCCDIIKEKENCCSSKKIDVKSTVDQSVIEQIKILLDCSYLPFIISSDNTCRFFKTTIKKRLLVYNCNNNSPSLFKLLCCFVTYG